jgi:hypothetical protein
MVEWRKGTRLFQGRHQPTCNGFPGLGFFTAAQFFLKFNADRAISTSIISASCSTKVSQATEFIAMERARAFYCPICGTLHLL